VDDAVFLSDAPPPWGTRPRLNVNEGESSVHHPDDEPNAKDDAPDRTALAMLAAKGGGIRSILFA